MNDVPPLITRETQEQRFLELLSHLQDLVYIQRKRYVLERTRFILKYGEKEYLKTIEH